MNDFIILLLKGTDSPFSSVSFWVMLIIGFVVLSSWRKRRLVNKLDLGIDKGDEVITVQGSRGYVEQIEEKNVSIRTVDGKQLESQLDDCVPVKVLAENHRKVKIVERVENMQLSFADKNYFFPLQSLATNALKWMKTVVIAKKGIELMIVCMIIDVLMNISEVMSFLGSGGRSFFQYDFVEDILIPIALPIGIVIGCIMHLIGLYGMENMVYKDDAKALEKVHRGIYFFIVAEIVDFFPLTGLVCTILYIIGFAFFIVGYSRLKNSAMQSDLARSGYSMAFTASIILLVGYVLPGIGQLVSLVGYILYYMAWANKICKSSFVDTK